MQRSARTTARGAQLDHLVGGPQETSETCLRSGIEQQDAVNDIKQSPADAMLASTYLVNFLQLRSLLGRSSAQRTFRYSTASALFMLYRILDRLMSPHAAQRDAILDT